MSTPATPSEAPPFLHHRLWRRAFHPPEPSFFGEQTTQVGYDAAIPDISDILVNARAQLLRQLRQQVGCVAHAQSFDVFCAIGIHRVRTDFFSSRDVRTGNNHFLDGDARLTGGLWRGRWLCGNVLKIRTQGGLVIAKHRPVAGGLIVGIPVGIPYNRCNKSSYPQQASF